MGRMKHFDLELRPHRQTLHDGNLYQCSCNKKFKTFHELQQHIVSETQRLKKKYNDLRTKPFKATKEDPLTTYKCMCGKKFVYKKRFIQHMQEENHYEDSAPSPGLEKDINGNLKPLEHQFEDLKRGK